VNDANEMTELGFDSSLDMLETCRELINMLFEDRGIVANEAR
jgi:hypothetical protein